MKKFRLLVAALLLFVPAVGASARTYDCELTARTRDSTSLERMVLSYDPEAESGAAYDGIIHSIHEAPIPVEFKRESETRAVWRWTLKNVQSSNGGRLTLSYTARINEKTGRISVYVVFHGYDNEAISSGRCKLIS